MHLAKFRICYLESEMKQMINDKTKDNQAADDHCSRGHRRSLIDGNSVFLRFCQAIFLSELNCRYDVCHKSRE